MEAATNSGVQNYINRNNFDLMDHTDAGTAYTYSQVLTGGNNSQVGLAKSYKVYPGDKVRIEAWAKYYNPRTSNGNLLGFAAALLNAFGLAVPGPETGTAASGLNAWGGAVAGGATKSGNGFARAYVNLVVFDKNYNLLDVAWDQINGGEQPVGNATKLPHDFMSQEYTAREEGYIFVYLSNENPTEVDVYFDDVVFTHTPGNLIQYNEYYPYGQATASSWTRENTVDNNFLANSGTEFNATTQLYDLDFRNYDPALGRLHGVDPMAAKYSSLTPYNFSFNNPVSFSDPSGADPNAGCVACSYAYMDPDSRGRAIGGSSIFVPMDPGGGGVSWNPATAGGYGVTGGGVYREFGMSMSFGALSYSEIGRDYEQRRREQMRRDAENLSPSEYASKYGYEVNWALGQMPHLDTGAEFAGNMYLYLYDEATGSSDVSMSWEADRVQAQTIFDRAPSGWDTYVPIWGSGKQAAFWFGEGDVSRGMLYSALAISDVFLVKAALTAIARVGVTTAAKTSSNILLNTSRQLQAKFKHAGDFGVLGNYSKANAGKFSSAINQHINSAGVQTINGTYRGQSVIHYLNPNTGLNVISSPSGQFISGWKLNPAQLQNVLKHGGL